MFSEPFQWEFAAPSASDRRPFAVGDRMEQRARRASARRERDLARERGRVPRRRRADDFWGEHSGMGLVEGLHALSRGVP